MGQALDVYRDWLGIADGPRPPDHYTLLGVPRGESDVARINSAADARLKIVRPRCLKFPEQGSNLLNEITLARLCLTDEESRAAYDGDIQTSSTQSLNQFATIHATFGDAGTEATPSETVNQKVLVGIDLGPSFASVAFINEDGQPQAIHILDDDSTSGSTSYSLASAIYFQNPTEVVVGNRALDYSFFDPTRLATRFMRQMGENIYLRDARDEQNTKVPFEVDGRIYRPEELSAMVLRRLKQAAETQLGPIHDVVISVPFVFDESRRRATQNAGRIAGFQNIELIDEPMAAAIAYGHNLFQGSQFHETELRELLGDQRILVYDLREGTFDATLVQLQTNGVFKVLATEGDERLGGRDWDDILLEMVCSQFSDRIGENPHRNPELMHELLLKTIEARKTLSIKPRADIELDYNGQPCKFRVHIGEFSFKTRHLVDRTIDTIRQMLSKLHSDWSFIDKIVVVGQAGRMPMIKKHLELVSCQEINLSLSPDTAIAHGAALFAALKSGQKTGFLTDVETVTSHALGLLVMDPKTNQPINDIIIPQNSTFGTKATRSYVVEDLIEGLTLIVMQGNSSDPDVCLKVGRVTMLPPPGTPPPEPGKKHIVAVSYSLQDNGLLRAEGMISIGEGRNPVAAIVELVLDNTMSENEMDIATSGMRGIDVE